MSPRFRNFLQVKLSFTYILLAKTQVCSHSWLQGKVETAQLNLDGPITAEGEHGVFAGVGRDGA